MPDNPELSLVIGGARSGKSAHAESLVRTFDPPWHYMATAEILDDEMKARIEAHQARRDHRWLTIEAPLDLVGALKALPRGGPVMIDCLTLWLTNHLLADHDVKEECEALADCLAGQARPTIVVSNEVGQGIVPGDTLSRDFRDAAGRLNQMIASVSGSVILTVAGIPMRVK